MLEIFSTTQSCSSLHISRYLQSRRGKEAIIKMKCVSTFSAPKSSNASPDIFKLFQSHKHSKTTGPRTHKILQQKFLIWNEPNFLTNVEGQKTHKHTEDLPPCSIHIKLSGLILFLAQANLYDKQSHIWLFYKAQLTTYSEKTSHVFVQKLKLYGT